MDDVEASDVEEGDAVFAVVVVAEVVESVPDVVEVVVFWVEVGCALTAAEVNEVASVTMVGDIAASVEGFGEVVGSIEEDEIVASEPIVDEAAVSTPEVCDVEVTIEEPVLCKASGTVVEAGPSGVDISCCVVWNEGRAVGKLTAELV